MSDKMLDWIEDHRVIIIAGIIIAILLIAVFGIRASNAKKAELKAQQEAEIASEEARLAELAALEKDEEEIKQPVNSYKNSLGLDADSDDDERIQVKDPEPEPEPVKPVIQTPKFDTKVVIFDNTAVPEKMVDGSDCKQYLSEVTLADFGTYWGSSLTQEDFDGGSRYLVGVEQNPQDFNRGDLQSVGWLHENISTMNQNDCIKFTNLHVIGSLSNSHVALLCAYDWYSAFGLKDVLVVFEDISGTLDVGDFKDGDVFSATAFVHNIKVVDVNNQRVVCVEYDVFTE